LALVDESECNLGDHDRDARVDCHGCVAVVTEAVSDVQELLNAQRKVICASYLCRIDDGKFEVHCDHLPCRRCHFKHLFLSPKIFVPGGCNELR